MTNPRAMPPADDPQLQYAAPQVKQAETGAGRPLRTWMILLCVWFVGLVIWAAYLVALVYLAMKVL
jgi:hypothetical protein